MKTKRLLCSHCKNAWRVDCENDEGFTRLHGCTKPRKQKFSKDSKLVNQTCKDFVSITSDKEATK